MLDRRPSNMYVYIYIYIYIYIQPSAPSRAAAAFACAHVGCAGVAVELQLRVCGHERDSNAAPGHGVEGDVKHRHALLFTACALAAAVQRVAFALHVYHRMTGCNMALSYFNLLLLTFVSD